MLVTIAWYAAYAVGSIVALGLAIYVLLFIYGIYFYWALDREIKRLAAPMKDHPGFKGIRHGGADEGDWMTHCFRWGISEQSIKQKAQWILGRSATFECLASVWGTTADGELRRPHPRRPSAA